MVKTSASALTASRSHFCIQPEGLWQIMCQGFMMWDVIGPPSWWSKWMCISQTVTSPHLLRGRRDCQPCCVAQSPGHVCCATTCAACAHKHKLARQTLIDFHLTALPLSFDWKCHIGHIVLIHGCAENTFCRFISLNALKKHKSIQWMKRWCQEDLFVW